MYWLARQMVVPTEKFADLVCVEGGRKGGFESRKHLLKFNNGDVAHQVEQQTENLCVVGSSPTVATSYFLS